MVITFAQSVCTCDAKNNAFVRFLHMLEGLALLLKRFMHMYDLAPAFNRIMLLLKGLALLILINVFDVFHSKKSL